MLATHRHRRLLELLQKTGSLRTIKAAKALRVTEETIRRDFEKLEAEGALQRSHGGAVRLEGGRREISEEEREQQNIEAKRAIATAASHRIQPGQTLFFDASTTTKQLALLLPDDSMTVVTNALQIALILLRKPSVQVIVLGGHLRTSSTSCSGWAAESLLESVRIDIAFLSCRGFDAEQGASEATEDQARLKRRVVEHATEVCLLADASKVGVSSSYYFAKPAQIDQWITDRAPSGDLRKSLSLAGMRIDVVKPKSKKIR